MTAPAPSEPGAVIPGVGYTLPPGERVLWVGAPGAARVAREAMHVRVLAGYFLVLLLAPALAAAPGARAAALLAAAAWVVPLGVATVLFARTLGTLVARTTVYAITDQRIVLKLGVALPTTFNIPLATVDAVDVRVRADGTGDVVLTLGPDVRIAWLLLWPHARPWRLGRPQPMLRAIDGAADVARVLGTALATRGAPEVVPAAAALGPSTPRAGSVAEGVAARVAVPGRRMAVGVRS